MQSNRSMFSTLVLCGARCLCVSALRLRAGLLAAVWAVPWPIDTGFDEGSRYNTLLQISVGQEEIDEVRERRQAKHLRWLMHQQLVKSFVDEGSALHGRDGWDMCGVTRAHSRSPAV